jgi:hypothetical protein
VPGFLLRIPQERPASASEETSSANTRRPQPCLSTSGAGVLRRLLDDTGAFARVAAKTEAMEDLGYMVIRFGHKDDWNEIVNQYPHVFGGLHKSIKARTMSAQDGRSIGSDLDLFEPEWHPVVEPLASLEGIDVEGGTDISDGSELVGQSVMEVAKTAVRRASARPIEKLPCGPQRPKESLSGPTRLPPTTTRIDGSWGPYPCAPFVLALIRLYGALRQGVGRRENAPGPTLVLERRCAAGAKSFSLAAIVADTVDSLQIWR